MPVTKKPIRTEQTQRNKIEEAIEKSAKSAREGRLIVRNVGFNVTVDQLRERFRDHGELVEVVLPPSKRTAPVTADGRKMRIPPHAGYGFVEFDTREQAQQGITAVNGSRIGGRPVAVDFAYDIRLYQAIKSKTPEPPAPKSAQTKTDEVKEEVEPQPKKQKKAVPKVEKQEEKPAPAEESAPSKNGKKTVPAKPAADSDIEKRKLFLVNVPFDATRADIESSLCEFGSIESGSIESVLFVKDKESQKPTGRCFVIFNDSAVADKIQDLENASRPQLFGDLYKNKDERPAVAPLEGAGCVILGRRISILKPLSKKDLEERKRQKEEEEMPRNPKILNRKNIDFVNAGWINETHEELWAALSERDQKLRQTCNEEKKFKLKNPNFVINTKRLMVRNVPKHMENGDLQNAILKAMKITGPKKVKQAGIVKVAIAKDKLMVAAADRKPKEIDFDMNAPESDNETTGNTKVEMKERKKSRGFAFVDFVNSESAMKCLEAMNNVPGAFGPSQPNRRPIVEFSFDDVRKLQIQKQRELKTQQPGKGRVEKVITKKPRDEAKLSRGQRQRAKRRAMREAAEANNSK
jgi:RNA recognition motif-containing protein